MLVPFLSPPPHHARLYVNSFPRAANRRRIERCRRAPSAGGVRALPSPS
jgi:hypothetical protein